MKEDPVTAKTRRYARNGVAGASGRRSSATGPAPVTPRYARYEGPVTARNSTLQRAMGNKQFSRDL